MKHLFASLSFTAIVTLSLSQSTTSNNNQNFTQTRFIGFNNNYPLSIRTNSAQRMFINDGSGINAGYVGIGLNFSSPIFPLHVVGDPNSLMPQGWKRGIAISNQGSLAFLKSGTSADNDFFMAAPSGSPNGDFFVGMSNNLCI